MSEESNVWLLAFSSAHYVWLFYWSIVLVIDMNQLENDRSEGISVYKEKISVA